jgi:cobalt-zinc-cadmium efflux system protein
MGPRLAIALGITAAFLVVEVVGGLLTGSLALVADGAHMGTDVAALSMALFATWFATRPHSARNTYGHQRVEILAALANGLALWLAAGFIFYQAAGRFQESRVVDAGPLLLVASLGLAANLASGAVLLRGARGSLNVRGALVHVGADALGSVGVVLAAVLMLSFSWYLADPIISVSIGVLVLLSSTRLILPALHILLESTPKEIDLDELQGSIHDTEGVLEVHDLHVWSLTSGYNAMTAHVVVDDTVTPIQHEEVLDRLRHMIPTRFPVGHVTIQLEESSRCCEEAHLPGQPVAAAKGDQSNAAP